MTDTPLSDRLARTAPFTLVIVAREPEHANVVLPFRDRITRDETARAVATSENVHALQIATRRSSGGAEVDTVRPHGAAKMLERILTKHRAVRA